MDEIGEDHFQTGTLNYTAEDGLARGWNMAGRSAKHIGKRTTHPIQDLMVENMKKWDNQLASQSRTLEDAVKEYYTRYGRLPPKGFDGWYNFCVENNVKIIDDVSRPWDVGRVKMGRFQAGADHQRYSWLVCTVRPNQPRY